MSYFTRLEEMDRVGFEPTISAMPIIIRADGYLSVFILII
jgi:hypothetical protein